MMTIMGLEKEKETKTIKIINIEGIKRIMASLMEKEGLMIEVIEEILNSLITKTWDLLKAGQDSRWNRIRTSKNRSRSGKGKLYHLVVKVPTNMPVISQKVLSQTLKRTIIHPLMAIIIPKNQVNLRITRNRSERGVIEIVNIEWKKTIEEIEVTIEIETGIIGLFQEDKGPTSPINPGIKLENTKVQFKIGLLSNDQDQDPNRLTLRNVLIMILLHRDPQADKSLRNKTLHQTTQKSFLHRLPLLKNLSHRLVKKKNPKMIWKNKQNLSDETTMGEDRITNRIEDIIKTKVAGEIIDLSTRVCKTIGNLVDRLITTQVTIIRMIVEDMYLAIKTLVVVTRWVMEIGMKKMADRTGPITKDHNKTSSNKITGKEIFKIEEVLRGDTEVVYEIIQTLMGLRKISEKR